MTANSQSSPGIDEIHVVTAVWREFREGLHEYNRHANAKARLRMRVAVHEGVTYIGENGFAGTAVNTVCRLRDSHEAKDALNDAHGDLVLIVSDRIYQDVICGIDTIDLPASGFTETVIDMPDKAFRTTAYTFSGPATRPDAPSNVTPAPGPTRPGERSLSPDAPADGSAGGAINFNGPIHQMRDVVRGTVHHHGERQ